MIDQPLRILNLVEAAALLLGFVENIGDDDPIKNRVFFHLRERVRESI